MIFYQNQTIKKLNCWTDLLCLKKGSSFRSLGTSSSSSSLSSSPSCWSFCWGRGMLTITTKLMAVSVYIVLELPYRSRPGWDKWSEPQVRLKGPATDKTETSPPQWECSLILMLKWKQKKKVALVVTPAASVSAFLPLSLICVYANTVPRASSLQTLSVWLRLPLRTCQRRSFPCYHRHRRPQPDSLLNAVSSFCPFACHRHRFLPGEGLYTSRPSILRPHWSRPVSDSIYFFSLTRKIVQRHLTVEAGCLQ